MTSIHLTFEQAEDIYRFFCFGPQDLDYERMLKTEVLFVKLQRKLGISHSDIDYLLMKSYLKVLIGKNIQHSSENNISKHALRRFLANFGGAASSSLFEDLYMCILSVKKEVSADLRDQCLTNT